MVLCTQTFLEKSLVPDALSGAECCGQVALSALGDVGLSAIGQAVGEGGLSAIGEIRLSAPDEVCARQQVHYSSRTMAPVYLTKRTINHTWNK
jgi:hypothetical protein